MKIKTFERKRDSIYTWYRVVDKEKSTILFLHGLGDSGSSFNRVWSEPCLKDYNLIVLDIVGFGRSSTTNNDYSLETQVLRINYLLDCLEEEEGLKTFYLVGHSMGGDIGTLLCKADMEKQNRIKYFVNIEGNITSDDLFISRQASEQETDFDNWFNNKFMQDIKDYGEQYASCMRYLRVLENGNRSAFLAAANALVNANGKGSPTLIGETYFNLKIPCLFCYGEKSKNEKTVELLKKVAKKENNFFVAEFLGAFHWVMEDNMNFFLEVFRKVKKHLIYKFIRLILF